VSLHVVFVGAGAIGGFVGGLMARSGHEVSLIDPWAEHIDRIRKDGLRVSDSQGEHCVQLAALHISDVQGLIHRPVDIAFICVKLYDTTWCSALIAPYLSAAGFVVTMQNSLIEEEIAKIVGWRRVVGCVASRIQVEAVAPGRVRRTNPPGGDAYTVFRVGEIHGRATARALQLAQMLSVVDSAKVTTNLWGERWSKLVANSMTSGVCAVSGLTFTQMYEHPGARQLIIRLAAEAIELGRVLGFELESVYGTDPAVYLAAARGDVEMLARLECSMRTAQVNSLDGGRSGIAQDLAKGRRTEVDYISGYVAARASEVGLTTPTQSAITAMVHAIERGELQPGVANIDALL